MTTDIPSNLATGRSQLGSVVCFFLVLIGLKLRLPFWSCKDGAASVGSFKGFWVLEDSLTSRLVRPSRAKR